MKRIRKIAALVPGIWLAASFAGVFCLAGAGGATAGVGVVEAARHSIKEADLAAHVRFLASDELGGRGFGTEGGRVTQRYLASAYIRLGLVPMGGDGSFFQEFEARGKKGRNVAALLRGSDPVLRDEIVAIGAHLDHLGRGRRGGGDDADAPIYNGADDNASGTASVLELAEAFRIARPRRSILFLHFDGEEAGLLGSRHFVEHPTVPLDRIVAMLNADMVGRSEEGYLFVGGTGTSPVLSGLVERTNEGFGLHLEEGEGGRAPSDSSPFYGKGIPVLFFFTNVHADYHRPSDDWDKINFPGMARIARFIFMIGDDLANEDARPAFAKADGMALPASFRERMQARAASGPPRPARPRLGIRLGGEEADGAVVVGGVLEGSVAARAGIRTGDRIVEIAGKPVASLRDLFGALSSVKLGQTVRVKVLRGDETVDLEAEFPPARPPGDGTHG